MKLALRGTEVSASIHTFVQHTDEFNTVDFRLSEEDHVATLREFSIAFSDTVDFCSYLRSLRDIVA